MVAVGGVPREYQQDINVQVLRGELLQLQERYAAWKAQQQDRLQQREMELEQLRADIERDLAIAANALATRLAEQQMAIETYAQAIARAITGTENPYQYSGSGAPFTPASQSGPLSLPG